MSTSYERRDWRSRAACRDTDGELFFPTAESGSVLDAQVAAAKAVCAGCGVRAECLDEALARIPYGIAGGLTEHERQRLRVARTRTSNRARPGAREGSAGGLTEHERQRLRVARTRTSNRARPGAGEGSAGGHRAPLRISHPTNPQAGTRAAEGHRG